MLHILSNAPRTVVAGEREYKVGALKLRELGALQRWIGEHCRKPSDVLRDTIDLVPEAERAKAVADARQADHDWPPAPGTVLGNSLLFGSLDGQMEFLRVMLGKFQAVTDAELEAIAGGLSETDFGVLVAVAFGDDDLDPEHIRAAVQERLEAVHALQMAAARLLDGATAETSGESESPNSGPTSDPSTKSST